MSHPSIEESSGLTLGQTKTNRFDIIGTSTGIILQKCQYVIKILYSKADRDRILSQSQNLKLANTQRGEKKIGLKYA